MDLGLGRRVLLAVQHEVECVFEPFAVRRRDVGQLPVQSGGRGDAEHEPSRALAKMIVRSAATTNSPAGRDSANLWNRRSRCRTASWAAISSEMSVREVGTTVACGSSLPMKEFSTSHPQPAAVAVPVP